MRRLIRMEWTTPRRLAALALALGLLALAGNPVRGHVVKLDTQELALVVGGRMDQVAAPDLAGRIVRGAADYRLLDLREPAEFARYHIPTAENVPMARLATADLARNENIVLCAESGVRTAQAWMLLRAQGYRGARMLAGGLEAWRDEVVFPAIPASPTPQDAARFERAAQLARFFGGHAREASAVGGATLTLSQVVPPPTTAAPQVAMPLPAGAGGKRAKEGC